MTDQALHLREHASEPPAAAPPRREPPAPPSDDPPPSTDDRLLFSTRVRRGLVTYVLATLPVVALVLWHPREPHEYLIGMMQVGLLYVVPGSLLSVQAALRSPSGTDRLVRWLWAGVFFAGLATSYSSMRRIHDGMDPSIARVSAPVIVGLLCLVVANTLIMRARSGQRAALVDGVDLVMATIAIAAPLAVAFGRDVVESPVPWFTLTAAMWFVASIHGTLVSLVIRGRTAPGHRAMANAGVLFGVIVMASSLGHVVLSMRGFDLPAGPFLALYAASAGAGTIFYAHTSRRASPGLERLPLSAQVRRHSTITVLVLASIPLLVAVAWSKSEDHAVVFGGLGAVLVLLALSSVRNLLAARETLRLYALVEQSAQTRGELLAEVMNHVDTDRHRAAAHLHRQAASLHTAMASFTAAIDQAVASGNPAAVSFAAERLRRDLGYRADALRRVAEAVRPLSPDEQGSRRIVAPMRAYIEKMCGDGPRPELHFEIDPELVLDWTIEAAVLRIVQEATLNAWWWAGATSVSVSVGAGPAGVEVTVTDNGCGEIPERGVMAGIRTAVRFLGGDVVSERTEQGGAVQALLPTHHSAPAEGERANLRLVES